MLAACARRNARQDDGSRSGAGRRPAARSTFRTEVAETAIPTPFSSPTIRRYPQCGFSRASRTICARSDASTGGRPGFLCGYVQRRATSWRCQRSSVSGLTGKPAQAGRGSERLSAANSARSARVSVGRAFRRRTARPRSEWAVSSSESVEPGSRAGSPGYRVAGSAGPVFAGMGCDVPMNARPVGRPPRRLRAAASSCRLSAKLRQRPTADTAAHDMR
jgi:hypothetical protein